MKRCNKCGGLIEEVNCLPICLRCWDGFVNEHPVAMSPAFPEHLEKKLHPEFAKVASEILQKYEM